ncbi:aminotransferase [Bonamia ostreae]|uniref:Aminotransferase n=1 Tax=Bonamia ostreae TaxID=126728 RepID=A0ABV2AFQ0_9EUKA
MQNFAAQLKEQNQFVDQKNYTLRCLVCRRCFVGNEEAVKHGSETGHSNFAEFIN